MPPINDDDDAPGPEAFQSFSTLLAGVEDGRLHDELTGEMQDLVRELNARLLLGQKAKGSLTLQITLLADRGVVEVTADYKVKAPKSPRGRSIFHVAGGKFLSRRDPNQPELPLRSVGEQSQPIRTVS